MAQQIDVPGMGIVEFPDGMTDNDIATAIKRNSSMSKLSNATPVELTAGERFAENLPRPIRSMLSGVSGGNLRGSAVGRAMQGAADPGIAIAQLAANAAGQGEGVNKAIQQTEADYQAARGAQGSSGFDPLRMAGNVAMTMPVSLAGGAATSLAGTAGKGALQGAGLAALQPVDNGGAQYWQEKLKQLGIGAATGGLMAPITSSIARAISPAASTNPQLQLLQREGVKPTIGQASGGLVDRIEEKAQSLPLLGDAIRSARQRAVEQFDTAAFNRAAAPIGETIKERGGSGIQELGTKLGKEYERVIPQLSVNAVDPAFVQKIASLRSLVSALPQKEQSQFDSVIAKEIDGRLAPNGMLSGQNLKDTWNALRDTSQTFSKSNDAYQSQLGQAFKQAFQELKNHVAATNPPDVVRQLRNTDLGYANFKRLQRAASSVSAEDGAFTPSQLHSAVRALDTSKDKARFATGDALMQDLSAAGKQMLNPKVPNSGTYDRAIMGGLIMGSPLAPHVTLPVIGGLGIAAGAYTAPVQNALVALLTKRPDMAPQVASYLKQLSGPMTAAAIPTMLQGGQ